MIALRTAPHRLTTVLAVAVAATGARAQLETKLPASGLAQGDYFGSTVAIDGARAVVGSPGDDDLGLGSGSARVFERPSGYWVETAKLLASDGFPADGFGASVDVEGARIAVGASREGDTGSVYVLGLAGGTWVEEAKLVASDGDVLDWFGTSIALAGDRLVIGASGADDAGTDSGAAYVFDLVGGAWVQRAKLVASDGEASDQFGFAVAADGARAVAGAWAEGTQGFWAGAAYVYELQGTTWVETQKLLASDGAGGSFFGSAVAIDGTRALVGAQAQDASATNTGAAYVFDLVGGAWVESAVLTASDALAYDFLGGSVGLQGDLCVVGAEDKWNGTNRSGAAYVYELQGAAWVETTRMLPSEQTPGFEGDDFGAALDVSGSLVVVGAPTADQVASASGAAFVYDLDCVGEGLVAYCAGKANSEGCVPWIACAGGPPSAAGAFTVVGNDVLNNKPGLLFYGTSGRAALPWQGGTLCVQPGLQRTPPQQSGGNPPPNDCSGTYAFDFGAHVASGTDPALVPGATVNAQYWYRDPQDAQGSGLTNALEVVLE